MRGVTVEGEVAFRSATARTLSADDARVDGAVQVGDDVDDVADSDIAEEVSIVFEDTGFEDSDVNSTIRVVSVMANGWCNVPIGAQITG